MVTEKKSSELVWAEFSEQQSLSPEQEKQFKHYYNRLLETNEIHNLTTITDLSAVISDHFDDSLALRNFIDFSTIKSLSDIGTGGGFPGIPLKILFPHLSLVLIEVNHKKIKFLEELADDLELTNVIISDLDWRTFLRKTNYEIDLFCARASLQPEELIRMFKPNSPYKNGQLVYWASRHWIPSSIVAPLIKRREDYMVGEKKRQFVFF